VVVSTGTAPGGDPADTATGTAHSGETAHAGKSGESEDGHDEGKEAADALAETGRS
jgi:hypothetical protein